MSTDNSGSSINGVTNNKDNVMVEQSKSEFFYRYQSINELTLGNLKRGEYLFSTPSELNDGNEGYPKIILQGDKEAYLRFSYWVFCQRSEEIIRHTTHEIFESGQIFSLVAQEISKLSSKRPLQVQGFKELAQNAMGNLKLNDDPILNVLVSKLDDYLVELLLIDINRTYSTLSFSKSPFNPTMWGHYAEADKGLVIVHESKDNEIQVQLPIDTFVTIQKVSTEINGNNIKINEIGASKRGELKLQNVSYRKSRPQINLIHWFSHKFFFSEAEDHYDYPAEFSAKQASKDYEKFMLYKSSNWRYEQEARLILEGLNDYQQFKNTRENRIAIVGGMTAVILGRRISRSNAERVVSALKLLVQGENSLNPKTVLILRLDADENRFEYKLKVIGKVGVKNNMAKFTAKSQFTSEDIKKVQFVVERVRNSK